MIYPHCVAAGHLQDLVLVRWLYREFHLLVFFSPAAADLPGFACQSFAACLRISSLPVILPPPLQPPPVGFKPPPACLSKILTVYQVRVSTSVSPSTQSQFILTSPLILHLPVSDSYCRLPPEFSVAGSFVYLR